MDTTTINNGVFQAFLCVRGVAINVKQGIYLYMCDDFSLYQFETINYGDSFCCNQHIN